MAFLGDDKSLVYELILALVSLWLLVDSIKWEKSQRETSKWFFLIQGRCGILMEEGREMEVKYN